MTEHTIEELYQVGLGADFFLSSEQKAAIAKFQNEYDTIFARLTKQGRRKSTPRLEKKATRIAIGKCPEGFSAICQWENLRRSLLNKEQASGE